MSPPRDLVCYHEAGHAVAHCRFLFGVREARYCPTGEYVHDGNTVQCWGAVPPIEGSPPEGTPRIEQDFRRIIAHFAGPFVEGHYTQSSLRGALGGYGSTDLKHSQYLANSHCGDDPAASAMLESAAKITEQFVLDFWQPISNVAAEIDRYDFIAGDHPFFNGIRHIGWDRLSPQ
jgi:hypothetical protein